MKINYFKTSYKYAVKYYQIHNDLISLCTGPLRNNSYILLNKDNEAIFIDPGYDSEELLAVIKERKAKLQYMLCTHGHVDHVGAVGTIQKIIDVPCYINKGDEKLLNTMDSIKILLGMPKIEQIRHYENITPETNLLFGNEKINVYYTPGHSPGGCCFLYKNYLFTGDTLFYHTIGRTDIRFSNQKVLLRSLLQLKSLPVNTLIYPGHGKPTILQDELLNNPYLKENNIGTKSLK